MELITFNIITIICFSLMQKTLSLFPIYHIKESLTEENEVFIYSIFNKVDNFYKNHMNDIVSDYITKYKAEEDIKLMYAQQKMPSSLRRKTYYMIKPFYKQRPYLNDIVRCSIIFQSKKSLIAFNEYFILKYGNYIVKYDNTLENPSVRFKVIVIKYSVPLFYLSMNVYTESKCFLYPFFEIQFHLINHFNYQSMTHWLYDGYRCLKIIEMNYNKSEFFSSYDYLNDTMSMHPIHILFWINRITNKTQMSSFELLFYRTKYYFINKLPMFINKRELRQFALRYLMICRMFLNKEISNHDQSVNQLKQIVNIKQAINELLTHIHSYANNKDMNE